MLEAMLCKGSGLGGPGPGVWGAHPSMPPRYLHAVVAYEDSLFLFGGRSPVPVTTRITRYNPSTRVFTEVGVLPWAADSLQAVLMDGLIYVYSGNYGTERFGNLVTFNPVTNAVVVKAPGIAVAGPSLAAIKGKLYAFGGQTSVVTNTLRCYDPLTNAWTTLTPSGTTPVGRYYTGTVALDDKMYLVSGMTTGGGFVREINIYDPVANAWEPSIPTPFGFFANGIQLVGKKIYVFGGRDDGGGYGGYTNKCRVFDTETKTWYTVKPMDKVISYQGCGMVDGVIYSMGGYDGPGATVLGDVLTYIPAP